MDDMDDLIIPRLIRAVRFSLSRQKSISSDLASIKSQLRSLTTMTNIPNSDLKLILSRLDSLESAVLSIVTALSNGSADKSLALSSTIQPIESSIKANIKE